MARSDRFNEAEAQEVRAQLDAQNLELRAQLEAENQELRAQLSACSEEVHMLNEHLEDYRHENDYLSQKIYRIEHDLADERLENASREHFLLRHNTPGAGGGSRVSFYGVTEEITSPGSISPHSQRTDSVFESTHPDSEFEDEDPTLVEDIGLPVRASSVMEYKDRVGSVDSGGTIERRSMSYHDISDVHMQQYGYRSHLPIQNYGYVQDAEYIDDELVPSSYYADEHTPEECMSCKETGLRMVDLDKQLTSLDEQLDDKEAFIENQEFELEELKTQLRSLKLDKDIVQYELTKQVEFATEKLNNTESSLIQKDQAYMDLLERFVSLEQNYEEVNIKYKTKLREFTVLSDKLSTVEFDLMLAEEQIDNRSALAVFANSECSTTASSSEDSCPNSPTTPRQTYHHEKRHPVARMEKCTQQPLSIRLSDSSGDMWDDDPQHEEGDKCTRNENLNKNRIDVDKLQDVNKEQRICVRSVINTYEAYRITFKETTPDTEGTKENCRGNDDT